MDILIKLHFVLFITYLIISLLIKFSKFLLMINIIIQLIYIH